MKIIKQNRFTPHHFFSRKSGEGFTLVETLVAVALLTVAIAAPMSLTTQSLSTAYYARDQIIASNLAQEAIESVRHMRDGNILNIGSGASGVDMLQGIPSTNGDPFTIDAKDNDITPCSSYPGGACPVLSITDGLYGYGNGTPTGFTRTVSVTRVDGNNDEYRVQVTISWRTGGRERTFVTSENLYRWLNDGSTAN